MSNSLKLPNRKLTRDDFISDRRGLGWRIDELDDRSLETINKLVALYKRNPPSHEFRNHWMEALGEFADAQRIDRASVRSTAFYQIGADLNARLMIEQGLARDIDYRDELESLVTSSFSTRRAFCEATGLSEDMLSHVLAKRKNFGIDTLAEALDKIGYAIHILPRADVSVPSSRSA